MERRTDVIIVGAGHNGLVAALLLAGQGLEVLVLEEKDVVGGAADRSGLFQRPRISTTSTGAYLLGLMPPELLADHGRRSAAAAARSVTTSCHAAITATCSSARTRRRRGASSCTFFSERDWKANAGHGRRDRRAARRYRADLAAGAALDRGDRRAFRAPGACGRLFVDLCRKPIRDYLERFGFKSDLVKAMYAVTDGFSGLYGTWDTPGTGMNFLVHNMCRLPGSGGTWMIVEGGMGTITQRFAERGARGTARRIETGSGVAANPRAAAAWPAASCTTRGEVIAARAVVVNADPFRMRDLVGSRATSRPTTTRASTAYRKPGTTLKVNLALKGLPRFTCLPERSRPIRADHSSAARRRRRDAVVARRRSGRCRTASCRTSPPSSGTSTARSIRRVQRPGGASQLRALRAVGSVRA